MSFEPKEHIVRAEVEGRLEFHDGINLGIVGDDFSLMQVDINEALNQDNPRNVFLNGQLHMELRVDRIICRYFALTSAVKYTSISHFLKLEKCSFETKIQWLKLLLEENESTGERKELVDKKIINSLRTIGNIRNAFHHNLSYEEALHQSSKDGTTFHLIDKKLSGLSLVDLVKEYKREVLILHEELRKIADKLVKSVQ